MFRQAVVLTLALIIFSSCSLAQMNNNPFQRPTSRANAQDVFNSITGTVRSSDNQPLKDVRIELREVNSSSVIDSGYTTASGSFELQHVRQGAYEVVATYGLNETRERVEVNGMSTMVNLRMPVSVAANDGNGQTTVSVAQYKIPQKARDELKKAREASAKQKPDEAQKHIAKALEIYPKYADALTLRGIFKLDAKDTAGAVAYLVMGAVLNTQSKFDDAIHALEHGEALSPNSWQAYFEMGKSLVGKTQYEAALRQLDKAQSLAPADYPLIHLVKAHAMLAMNNYNDAMTELQAYLEKDPNGPNSAQAQKMLAQAKAFAASHPGK
jgi:tetratricopeptide (TPR) repeat protein